MRISTIVRFYALLMALVIPAVYVLRPEPHPYVSAMGLALILAFLGLIAATSGRFASRFPLALLVNAFVLLYLGTRTLVLVIDPSAFLIPGISPWMFEETYLFILLGTAAALAGTTLGPRFQKRDRDLPLHARPAAASFPIAWEVLFGVFLLAVFAQLAVYLQFGYVGGTESGAEAGFLRRYGLRLLNPALLMLIGLVLYLPMRRLEGRNLLIAMIAIFLVYKYITGNRGAILEVVTLAACLIVFWAGNARLRVSAPRLVVGPPLVVAGVLVAAALYMAATEFRNLYWYGDFDIGQFLAVTGSVLFDGDRYVAGLFDISYRLNLVEATFVPMHHSALGLHDLSDRVTVATTLQLIVDRLVPGDVFSSRPVFTEYAFGAFFEGNPVESGRGTNVGYEWGLYGISYQLFGFSGGLVFIFAMTAALARACRWLRRYADRSPAALCLGALASYTLYEWVRNLGLDNLADRTFMAVFVLVLYIGAFTALGATSRIRPHLPSQSVGPEPAV